MTISKEEQEWIDNRPPVPSHARVIEYKVFNNRGVVLCDLGYRKFSPTKKEYATWTYYVGDTGVGAGMYFYSISEASNSYKERC